MNEVRLIDANALIREMCTKFYTTPYYKHILDVIDNAPTVERPQGKWIYNQYDDWHCSECRHLEIGGYNQKPSANFCPNCGADMRGDT